METGGAITASTGSGPAGITTVCGNSVAGVGAAALAVTGAGLSPTITAGTQYQCENRPKGLDFGPGFDLIVMCSQTTGFYPAGTQLASLIMDRRTALVIHDIPWAGGDQVWFDPVSKRYIMPTGNWTANGGKAAVGTNTLTPRLQIIDASSLSLVASLPMGQGAHSVAVDPTTGYAFVPYSYPSISLARSAAAACGATAGDCVTNGFTTGGISVFAIK